MSSLKTSGDPFNYVITGTLVPLQDRVDVVPAFGISPVEAEDVDDVEDHVDQAEEKGTPCVLDPARPTADPDVKECRH